MMRPHARHGERGRAIDATYGKTFEQRSVKASSITWEFGYGSTGALSVARSPYARLTRSFDTSGRLTEARAAVGPDPTTTSGLFDSRLAYAPRDRIAGVTYSAGTGEYADAYSYDPAGRLATWGRTGAGATSASYAWDAAGNLTSKTQGGVTTTFASDADDRLVSATTGTAVTTYTHDLYGRRTSAVSPSGTTTYTWNPLGQLTSVVSPQSTSVYSYGPTGMREKAVVTQGGTTKTTESIWEGGRLAAERDSDGTLYRYTYAPDGTPLALTRGFGEGAVTYSYHTDAAGSVVAITDPSGAVVASYRYDAFGAVTSVTGSDPVAERNPLRYRAYYHDASTGLYYLPARSYDPATARFLSPDPAPPAAGDPLSLNRYTYCAGDPVNFTDPTGAVIDVLGDGRVGVEDSVTQTYIYTPSGAKGTAAGARKYASRAAMVQAVSEAVARKTAMTVRNLTEAAYAAAHAYYVNTGGEVPPIASHVHMWDWSLTSPQDDPHGYGLSAVGALCDGAALAFAEIPPLALGFAGAGMIFGVWEWQHTWGRYTRDLASEGDVAMATAGLVPLLGLWKTGKGFATVAEVISGTDFILDSASYFD